MAANPTPAPASAPSQPRDQGAIPDDVERAAWYASIVAAITGAVAAIFSGPRGQHIATEGAKLIGRSAVTGVKALADDTGAVGNALNSANRGLRKSTRGAIKSLRRERQDRQRQRSWWRLPLNALNPTPYFMRRRRPEEEG